ncbi:programmed cell death 6-interacting protein-like [Kryptolebias marmoratus]|uniref:programmed cell death 6-interacting protein-like n=1 Tax=Kryptolebias marmoratus TaxID=37003 RepID=UPI0007F908A8|nr:programmed cell death 6-interacting protein-like [Kryptolebias marmoratus]
MGGVGVLLTCLIGVWLIKGSCSSAAAELQGGLEGPKKNSLKKIFGLLKNDVKVKQETNDVKAAQSEFLPQCGNLTDTNCSLVRKVRDDRNSTTRLTDEAQTGVLDASKLRPEEEMAIVPPYWTPLPFTPPPPWTLPPPRTRPYTRPPPPTLPPKTTPPRLTMPTRWTRPPRWTRIPGGPKYH